MVESELIPVLMDMEWHGIGFDSSFCRKYKQEIETKIIEITKRAHLLVGQEFNLGSPKDCSEMLFLKLQLPPPAYAVQMAKRKKKNNGKNDLFFYFFFFFSHFS